MIDRKELQKVTVEYLESVMGGIADALAASGPDKEPDSEDDEERKECRHLSMDGKEERGTGRKEGAKDKIPNIQTLHIYDCSNGICLESTVNNLGYKFTERKLLTLMSKSRISVRIYHETKHSVLQ